MSKICLINPGRTYYSKSSSVSGVDVGLPLGIMYLGAVLENAGHEVKIMDSLVSEDTILTRSAKSTVQFGVPLDKIKQKIKQFKPDLVGISNLFTAQIRNTIKTANKIRELDDELPIIVGGPHVTVDGLNFMRDAPSVDMCIIGEGEPIITEIVKFYEGKKNIGDINGIHYRKRDNSTEIVTNPKKSYIKNLDSLPYPAYHLVNMESYLTLPDKKIYTRTIDEYRAISMITSRGCPFNCVFCSVHHSMGRLWRPHSPEYVIKHIKHVVEEYDVRQIHFEDDNLTLDLNRCGRILDGIIKNKLKIRWDTPNGVRADRFNENIAKKMKQSGCVHLTMSVESGDQEVLDKIIGKNLKLENVINMAKIYKKVGIPLSAFYVIGFPGEKKENIKKTIDFALMLLKKYNVKQGGAFFATPLIGTRLYEICKKNNYLVRDVTPESLSESIASYSESLIKTEDFDPKYLKKMNQKLIRANYLHYLYHPSEAFKMLKKDPQIIIKALKRFMGKS